VHERPRPFSHRLHHPGADVGIHVHAPGLLYVRLRTRRRGRSRPDLPRSGIAAVLVPLPDAEDGERSQPEEDRVAPSPGFSHRGAMMAASPGGTPVRLNVNLI